MSYSRIKIDEYNKLDKLLRNIALILILASVILLVVWVINLYSNSGKETIYNLIIMSIGIALLLGGILLLTRIQYIIWIKKRFKKTKNIIP
ncbi:MAG: hypothetical protein ACTSO4_18265 [Promethearchaeota archaeon]